MIICYIPGSGGFRLQLFLENKNCDIGPGAAHIKLPVHRYITDSTVSKYQHPVTSTQLTHCMHTPFIKKLFPGHKIVKIKADLKQSLLREWQLVTSQSLNGASKLDSAYQLIVWHTEYYSKYSLDFDADVIIDIDTDKTIFGEVMRKELNRTDKVFEIAWTAYQQYGSRCPIIDMEKNYDIT
jgi:hypothetical protein